MPKYRLSACPRPVAMMLAGALCLGACHHRDAAVMLADARQAHAHGDNPAAIIELKNVLQKEAGNTAARLLLGELYLDQGDPVSAEKELRRAGSPPLLLARAMLLQGQFEQVLASLPPGVRQPAALALRGNALLGLGRPPEAAEQFQRALAQAELPDALLGLARIALGAGRAGEAGDLIRRALAADPAHIDCLRFQADFLRAGGKDDAALAVYQRVLALRPHNAQAHLDIANLHIDAGRFAQGRAAIEAARKVAGPILAVVYVSAVADYRENKLQAALESLQKVLAAAPGHEPAILLAGAVQSALGNTAQAQQYLEKFLAAHPRHLYASKLMSALMVRANKPQEALAMLAPHLLAHPADVELLTLAGEAHLSARQYGAATELFEKASAMRPRAPSLHTALALSRMANGEHARALAELEQAAALDRGAERTGILLVMTHLRAGATDQALAALREMQGHADNPLLHNLKGGVYLARQDRASARASFEKALALEPLYLPALANLAQLDTIENKAQDATRRYTAALARAPRNLALMEALAGLALTQGKPAEARAWLERARRDHPDALPLALRLADLYARSGDKQKALLLARTLQAANPDSPAAAAMLAQAYVGNHDLAAGSDAYARLAALVPTSAMPHLRLADLHLAMRDEGAAMAALTRALAIEPDLPAARITMINLLLRQKKFGEARAVALSAQQRQPAAPIGFKLEGDVLSAQAQHGAALKAYERAFALHPDSALLIQIHAALNQLGQGADADARMAAWFKQHPDDVPARLYHASSKLVKNQPRAAIEHLEAVVATDPKHIVALNDLAWACQRSGDRRALGFAERAFAQAPDSPAVIDTLGWILFESGNPARALPLLKKASALAPNANEIRLHFGMALARTGDKRGARRELEKLLASKRQFAQRDQAAALLASL